MEELTFLELCMKNFMSYGNNMTKLNLNFNSTKLIVGENIDDMVDGEIDSNGAGKTTILNAILTCLFDKNVSDLEKNDLINYFNKKDMEVHLTLKKGNTYYKIIRFRKNRNQGGDGVKLLKSSVNDFENEKKFKDITLAGIREANKQIVDVIGYPYDTFVQVLVFSASNLNFLKLPATHTTKANQRDIVENVNGSSELTKKGKILKEQIKDHNKELKDLKDLNDRILNERNRIETQINNVEKQKEEWSEDNSNKINELRNKIKKISKFDFKKEENHLIKLEDFINSTEKLKNELKILDSKIQEFKKENSRHKNWEANKLDLIKENQSQLKSIKNLDYKEQENNLSLLNEKENSLSELDTEISFLKNKNKEIENEITNIEREVETLSNNKCPYCEQTFKQSKDKVLEIKDKIFSLKESYEENNKKLSKNESEYEKILDEVSSLKNNCEFNNIKELYENKKLFDNCNSEILRLEKEENPYTFNEYDEVLDEYEKLKENIENKETGIKTLKEKCKFNSLSELKTLEGKVSGLDEQLKSLEKSKNPYLKTLSNLQESYNDMDSPKDKEITKLESLVEHEQFLHKSLTKKDSFLRKAILSRSMTLLNQRLSYYLKKLRLPHVVYFGPDLMVKISRFGEEMNYKMLSAGQKARVNLALCFAFRDVIQSRHNKVNFCILDECLDSGLGNVGVKQAAKMIKEVSRENELSMFVISHRDEVSGMFKETLKVQLKDGFSKIKEGNNEDGEG